MPTIGSTIFFFWGTMFMLFAVFLEFYLAFPAPLPLVWLLLGLAGLFWFLGYVISLRERYSSQGQRPYTRLPAPLVSPLLALHYVAVFGAPFLVMLLLLLLTGRVVLTV